MSLNVVNTSILRFGLPSWSTVGFRALSRTACLDGPQLAVALRRDRADFVPRRRKRVPVPRQVRFPPVQVQFVQTVGMSPAVDNQVFIVFVIVGQDVDLIVGPFALSLSKSVSVVWPALLQGEGWGEGSTSVLVALDPFQQVVDLVDRAARASA